MTVRPLRCFPAISACLLAAAFSLPAPAAEPPNGLPTRTAWTTSRVVGSPDPPPPYQVEQVFGGVRLDRPVDLACSPDGGRWFVCEEPGRIRSFANVESAATLDLTLDLAELERDPARKPPARQLWSLAFHPRFAENGWLFVCFVERGASDARCRIVRFTADLTAEKPSSEKPTSERVAGPRFAPGSAFSICEWPARQDHFGGCLKFGPDGMLYFSAGDGHGYADGFESGQDLSDWHASVLRIDVDRREDGRNYAVPLDNPFVALAGARPEVWAYGVRNIWKMSFDRQTGELWAGDVGQDLWEMVLRIEKGGNYGWSVTEGSHPFRPERRRGPTPILPPVAEHEHSQARSLTGGYVYRGSRLPELAGHYIYGDYDTGKIWGLRRAAGRVDGPRELVDTALRVVGFAEDRQGELFILSHTGSIHRLAPAPPPDPNAAARFPRKLSETGLFRSTVEHEPSAGVIPYAVNSPLWSDHAVKDRYLALPGDAKIDYRPDGAWKFPEGSVLVKTFSLPFEDGRKGLRRLETRLLHVEQDHWRGYTYLWNDSQTDAELLEGPRGLDRTYRVADAAAPGGVREQVWHFPSRAECTLCHTMPMGFALGLNTLQMNRDFAYPSATDNQLRALAHAGYFRQDPLHAHQRGPDATPPGYASLPRLPDPADEQTPLDARARSYLHANCAHCHVQWGGGNALFQLTYSLPLCATKTLDALPQHGDLEIPNARVLVAGAPERSLLWQRMRTAGRGRMPHVGSNVPDERGVELLRRWIEGLPR